MKKQELIEENWYNFRRIHCLEGFIDIWTGPDTDNPNNSLPSDDDSLILAVYYRLNGNGKWFHREMFDMISFHLSNSSLSSSAEEIWNLSLIK